MNMTKIDSNASLTIRPMPSETHYVQRTKGFPASPSARNLEMGGFNTIIKD